MKFHIFFPILLLIIAIQNNSAIAQSQKRTLIGYIENGNAVLSIDKSKMLSTYNSKLLKLSGIDAKFSDINIKSTTDKQYFLVFKSATYLSTFSVIAENSQLFAVVTISCTTSDCASEEFGCTPKVSGVACWPCNNKGKCTKTVSNDSLID
ncbi:MAG: hypothetical protein LC109_11280 [Bacteroidia bacterium]|nr:hypothetical protein [Bacteroidia bacterium]